MMIEILRLKILNGERRNQTIALPVSGDTNSNVLENETMPFLLENEAIEFHVFTSSDVKELSLLVDQIKYDFNLLDRTLEHETSFVLSPSKKGPSHYEALFFNYFGVVSLNLIANTTNDTRVFEVSKFEVLANKLTADQCRAMLRYIYTYSNESITERISATSLSSKNKAGGDRPEKVFRDLASAIRTVEGIIPNILGNPITRLSSEQVVRSGSQAQNLGEGSISWLAENLSVLEETDDSDSASVVVNGKYYWAREVQTPVLKNGTDTYENQVIHSFINHLIGFTTQLINGVKQIYPKQTAQNPPPAGYESFFTTVSSWLKQEAGGAEETLHELLNRLRSIQGVLNKKIPVRHLIEGLPQITMKVKSNHNYLAIFRLVIEWFTHNEIDWRTNKMLLNIKSIPTLFELYCAVKIKNILIKEYGDTDGTKGLWSQLNERTRLTLYYEPVFWQYEHSRMAEDDYIFNTEIRSVKKARLNAEGVPLGYNHHSHRKPDFVIELSTPGAPIQLLVFDAKYTSEKKAYKEHLPECVMKYVHGIGSKENSRVTRSLILIYPSTKESLFIDYHMSPFGLYDEYTQLPVLGIQSTEILNSSSGERGLKSTLNKLIENFCEDYLNSSINLVHGVKVNRRANQSNYTELSSS